MSLRLTARARVRRIRGRGGDRGAALFVVILAITLLTAIGVFTARAASMVDVSAGYNRQHVQTSYMSEYGARGATMVLGNGAAGTYVQQMQSGGDECRSNEGLAALLPTGAPVPCYKLFMAEVSPSFASNALEDATPALGGSLGPPAIEASRLTGNFVVEMTDPGLAGAPLAGFNAGGTDNTFRPVQIALTSQGLVRPFTPPSETTCNTQSNRSAAVASLRAHVITVVPQ